jgi:hypothetical protein
VDSVKYGNFGYLKINIKLKSTQISKTPKFLKRLRFRAFPLRFPNPDAICRQEGNFERRKKVRKAI